MDVWIGAACETLGRVRRGPARLRGRMWSVVARVPVAGGDLWFKANPPRSAFEPALAAALRSWSPNDAPPVLAVDTERAWALTEDVGERLDALLKQDPDVGHLLPPMRRYAALQRVLSDRVDDLLALGLPDARPGNIPALFENIVAHAPSGILDRDVVTAAEARLPELAAWADELEAVGVRASIDHQDLHPGNILGTGPDARPFDWGDACVAHPFGSLFIPLRALPGFLGQPVDAAAAAQLRAAYLEAWQDDGRLTQRQLEAAANLAMRLTMVMRAHTWTRTWPCFRESPEPWRNVEKWIARIGMRDALGEKW
ncbi:aminoglycoside phosphotransferase family protein [Actinospica robiniae]|uniref:aminoglycoside phosphotransferase family protein n=1 Tax=Actinospica robiniae TaxID=304901 RepID=UPI0012FB319F|nr:aminoglycoside phosphotransferase family protein [Actinospica robiniae]